MTGTLYVVGTPIGNLSDFSPRAVETLEAVDFIAAEDTRVTLKLLNHFGVKKPLVSYFEHNKRDHGEKILARLEAGENCALVSDAGMPAISDPGELLVAQCAERGIPVLVVPGPSAVVSALAVSGLPTGRFTFEGFLSVNKNEPPGPSGRSQGRAPHHDLLRGAAQALRHPARHVGRLGRPPHRNRAGVDEDSRGGYPNDPVRGGAAQQGRPRLKGRLCW